MKFLIADVRRVTLIVVYSSFIISLVSVVRIDKLIVVGPSVIINVLSIAVISTFTLIVAVPNIIILVAAT